MKKMTAILAVLIAAVMVMGVTASAEANVATKIEEGILSVAILNGYDGGYDRICSIFSKAVSDENDMQVWYTCDFAQYFGGQKVLIK